MEGILAKTGNDYILYSKDNNVLGITSGTIEGRKLSLHNCQAIENGYDLENLSRERLSTRFNENSGYHKFVFVEAYKEGFLKAMEILGDKKFSEDDLRLAMHFGKFGETNNQTTTIGFIKSLQQTEWDVEIDVLMTEREGGVVIETPKLDSEGCLILKRL